MKKYKLDYKVETELHENKKPTRQIIYTGNYYNLTMAEEETKNTRKIQLIYTIIISCFFISGGFLNNDGSRAFYIILPYVTMFIIIAYLIMGLIGLKNLSAKMEYAIYDKSILRINRTAKGIKWISSYLVIADIIFMISSRNTVNWKIELLFLFINAMIFIQGYLLEQENKKVMNKIHSE